LGEEVDLDHHDDWEFAGVEEDLEGDEGVELEDELAVGRDGVAVELHQHLEQPLPALVHAYIL
jgi:hypothetical protein